MSDQVVNQNVGFIIMWLIYICQELEETTAECNRVEHEVALLRSKVHGDMSRSRSAPSLVRIVLFI